MVNKKLLLTKRKKFHVKNIIDTKIITARLKTTVKSPIKAHSASNAKFILLLSPPGYRPMGLQSGCVVKRPQSRITPFNFFAQIAFMVDSSIHFIMFKVYTSIRINHGPIFGILRYMFSDFVLVLTYFFRIIAFIDKYLHTSGWVT